jgi:lysophospholipase L1-like esterase
LITNSAQDANAAAVYTEIYRDMFDDPSVLGTKWTTAAPYSISGGKLRYTGNFATPGTYYSGDGSNMLNGKIEYVVDNIGSGSDTNFNNISYTYGRYVDSDNYYRAEVWASSNMKIHKRVNGVTTEIAFRSTNVPANSKMRVEFIAQDVNGGVQLTVNSFVNDGATPFATLSKLDQTDTIDVAGAWGFLGTKSGQVKDEAALYRLDADSNLGMAIRDNFVSYGNSVQISLHASSADTITLSDSGAGGVWTSDAAGTIPLNNNQVELLAADDFGAVVYYTAPSAGDFELTATGSNVTRTENVTAIPYRTKVLFVGDSIACKFKQSEGVNHAYLGGALNNDFSVGTNCGGGWKTADLLSSGSAVAAINTGDYEIVHIMIGTNDAGQGVDATTYKANMQAILNDIFTQTGARLVVISDPPYRTDSPPAVALLEEYQTVNAELADGDERVMVGDTSYFDWSRDNSATAFEDGIHPNASVGLPMLADMWTDAIIADIEYQINPNHDWSTGSSFTLGSTETLTHVVDKYFGEFTGVVKVDGVALTGPNYTAGEGSTVIELSNSFLNSLTAGNHTLTVAFNGGVFVSSQFSVLSAGAGVPTSSIIPAAPNTGRK